MPNAFTLYSSALSCLLTVAALSQATAQASSIVPVDSSRQIDTTIHVPGDSLARQSAQSGDTLVSQGSALSDSTALDTLGRMSTPTLVGTYDRSLEKSKVLTTDDLHWLGYQYLGGILESVPGTYIRDQNGAGQYNQLNIRGVDWRGIAITMDGRLLNDPASGIFNLFHFSTEYADRVEIITGPRAFIYGLNSTGGAINLLTKNYNSNRPFTKINYSETGYNYQYSDGTFSQNISRKVNLTFGFQHQSTDGRFRNSAHEAWNGRVKVRYNLSKEFNVILSEYHTATETQLNGGVDIVKSGTIAGLNPFLSSMRNLDTYEKITRNDVDLSFVGTFLGDSVDVSMLMLYYSHSIREYRDGEDPFRQSTNGILGESDHTTSWMGARFAQNFDTEFQRFSLGGNIELRQIEGSPNLGHRRNAIGSVWAKEEFLLSDRLTLAAFGRYDQYLKKNYAGIGADASLRLQDNLSFFGGVSSSRRLPSYQELYWNDSTVVRFGPIEAERHLHLEAGAELTFGPNSFLRMSYFHRDIVDAIQTLPNQIQSASPTFPRMEFTNGPKFAIEGLETKLGLRIWMLYLEGVGTYMIHTSGGINTRLYPRACANGGVYYWNTLLNNKLELKVGFRGRYQSSLWGSEFNPEVLAYVPNTSLALGQAASGDLFIGAHIGDAYIQLIWGNLTSVQYYSTPFYPVLERALRVGISWEFLN